MRKPKKLTLKKITLKNLDELTLDAYAGAHADTVMPWCPTLQTGCYGQPSCLVNCTGNTCFGC
jgi:hypothetical protein